MSFKEHKPSGWATLHRVIGWLAVGIGAVLAGLIVLHAVGGGNVNDQDWFIVIIVIGSGIPCLFAAFCIDKLSEIAFYSQISAERNDEMRNHLYNILKIQNENRDKVG